MDRWKKDSRKDIVLGVEVTAGNVSDSVAWDAVYDQVTGKFPEVKFVTMDAGYKTPWIAKKENRLFRLPPLCSAPKPCRKRRDGGGT